MVGNFQSVFEEQQLHLQFLINWFYHAGLSRSRVNGIVCHLLISLSLSLLQFVLLLFVFLSSLSLFLFFLLVLVLYLLFRLRGWL